jgi:hypothetical protein
MSYNLTGISLDSLSFCTHQLHMRSNYAEAEMSTGTGFFYEHEEIYYIVNGHNVTKVNPVTGENLFGGIAFQNKISIKVRCIATNNESGMAA